MVAGEVGRPRIAVETRQLIREMARANFLWGAPRIHGELLKLGITVSRATVSRYMPRSCLFRPPQSTAKTRCAREAKQLPRPLCFLRPQTPKEIRNE